MSITPTECFWLSVMEHTVFILLEKNVRILCTTLARLTTKTQSNVCILYYYNDRKWQVLKFGGVVKGGTPSLNETLSSPIYQAPPVTSILLLYTAFLSRDHVFLMTVPEQTVTEDIKNLFSPFGGLYHEIHTESSLFHHLLCRRLQSELAYLH